MVDSGLLHVHKTAGVVVRIVLEQCQSEPGAECYLLSFILLLPGVAPSSTVDPGAARPRVVRPGRLY